MYLFYLIHPKIENSADPENHTLELLETNKCEVDRRGGFNGWPLVQWPTGPLALEAPGRGARPENNVSCIEFMIYLMIVPQNH